MWFTRNQYKNVIVLFIVHFEQLVTLNGGIAHKNIKFTKPASYETRGTNSNIVRANDNRALSSGN